MKKLRKSKSEQSETLRIVEANRVKYSEVLETTVENTKRRNIWIFS